MQVSHSHDHVTHAVVGGGAAINLGISDSPEFFQILSSTLYSDQKLAVVRETLCNAWDAHIMGNCTDTPIQVTLKNGELVIQDFGPGIPHDKIGPVYGVYGASTKKNDGKQTGGFGLGCKAPFAYTDHFEVTVIHDGMKGIYRMSKSSGVVMGKPAITPIVMVPAGPSDPKSGVTVTIPVKDFDESVFLTIIKRVIFGGEMKALINGKPFETLGFDATKQPWLIFKNLRHIGQSERILLRYGNVIYPVSRDPNIQFPYDAIMTFLGSLTGRYGDAYNILFQAPPHSIAVTPSRETLSMQDHTVKTLTTLFQGFLNQTKTQLPELCLPVVQTAVDKLVEEKKVAPLLTRRGEVPVTADERDLSHNLVDDMQPLAVQYMLRNYPDNIEFRRKDLTYRLTKLVEKGLLDRGKVQSYIKALNQSQRNWAPHYGYRNEPSDWLHRHILKPITTKLIQTPGLELARLYTCDKLDAANSKYGVDCRELKIVPVRHSRPEHIIAALPYLRNRVVLSRSKVGFIDLLPQVMIEDTGYLFYHVGRKVGEADIARNFFKSLGMEITDLVIEADEKIKKKKAPAVYKDSTPKVPRKKGLLSASFLINKVSNQLNTQRLTDPTLKNDRDEFDRVIDPIAVLLVPASRRNPNQISKWNIVNSFHLIKKYGDKVGITTSRDQQKTWCTKKGIMDFNQFIVRKTLEHLTNNPRVDAFMAHNEEYVYQQTDYGLARNIVKIIFRCPKYSQKYGVVNQLTAEDREYLKLWEDLKYSYILSKDCEVEVIKLKHHFNKLISTSKSAMAVRRAAKLAAKHPLAGLINTPEALAFINKDPEAKNDTTKTVLEILDTVFSL